MRISITKCRFSDVYSLCSLLLIFFFCHETGHGKIETMGALTISGLLLATGGGIAWSAVDTLQAWARYSFISHFRIPWNPY